ncbi:MAG: adenosylcobinamide-GDP ribazoletransferase [Candidatus Brocadiia bacterium]
MKALLAAIRFLTVVPVPGSWTGEGQKLADSVPFFPAVGLLIGAAAAGVSYGLSFLLGPFPAAVVLTLFLAAASGALHLDGLSDTADGFFSSRPRERILEIMRDSRVGSMGVLAIVGILALKISCLTSLPDVSVRWRILFLVPVAGRTALVIMIAILPYARPGGGLGTVFYRNHPGLAVFVALFVLGGIGWGAFGWGGIVICEVTVAAILIFALYCRGKIGGATGDTLGAACEIAEMLVLLGGVVIYQIGWQCL